MLRSIRSFGISASSPVHGAPYQRPQEGGRVTPGEYVVLNPDWVNLHGKERLKDDRATATKPTDLSR